MKIIQLNDWAFTADYRDRAREPSEVDVDASSHFDRQGGWRAHFKLALVMLYLLLWPKPVVRGILAFLVILGSSAAVPNAAAAVTLPIEVFGPDKTIEKVTVNVPVGVTNVDGLWMEIHALTLPNKASVKVNGGAWVNLNNETVAVEQPGKSFGGVGGGFATIKGSMKLARGLVVPGQNTLEFRFNDVTRTSWGYRVLRFNFTAAGKWMLPTSTFVEDNPQTWVPPINNSTAIAQGKDLWYKKALLNRGKSIQARCSDCHAHDGRDLKYFNYSNKSIIARSKFHGLTQTESEKVASYIRSLNVPYVKNGRPWNPPYQPGPGLDSRPVHEWAAGAGLNWVLDKDVKTFDHIFTNGVTSDAIAFKKMINAREIPLAIQFPDWNHWLPEIHPKDAWGTAFTSHMYSSKYYILRNLMKGDRLTMAKAIKTQSNEWYGETVAFFGRSGTSPITIPPTPWPLDYQIKYNSGMHWRLVKFWEIIHEFQLEDMGHEVLGTSGNDRTWYDPMLFNTAPHMMHLSTRGHPINDGSITNWNYFSASWYQLQITLNNSNRRPLGTDPLDWAYLHAFAGGLASRDVGSAGIMTLNLVTAAQNLENGKGPRKWNAGWDPMNRVNAYFMVPEPHFGNVWKQVPVTLRRKIAEAYMKNWIDKTASYPIEDYYYSDSSGMNGVFAKPTEKIDLSKIDPMGGRWIERYWLLPKHCRTVGVSETVINKIIDYGKRLWPNNPWDTLRSTVTAPSSPPTPTGLKVVSLQVEE